MHIGKARGPVPFQGADGPSFLLFCLLFPDFCCMSSLNNPATPAHIDQSAAILVGVYNRDTPRDLAEEYLQELMLLADTAGSRVVHTLLRPLNRPNASTLLGKGTIDELASVVQALQAQVVIFDMDLSPSQARNLEKLLGCGIMDRTALILDIFAGRARTAQAKAQVELARLEYELPRLTRMWTHLSRERGGIGMKGAGEQEIETDRRRIRERIAKLKRELQTFERQAATRRKHREAVVRAALVGYTNAGKSTLMNLLSDAKVLAEDKLFATLDTTVRRVHLAGHPVLLSDTVGFIRKLPHKLVESFKSTLDEVREADILLHVVDISSPQYLDQLRVVRQTLAEIGAVDKPTLLVFNKVDALDTRDLHDLEQTWLPQTRNPAVFVSAQQRLNIPQLRQELAYMVREIYAERYPGLAETFPPLEEALGNGPVENFTQP
jgi:GTP-binding protein HflX